MTAAQHLYVAAKRVQAFATAVEALMHVRVAEAAAEVLAAASGGQPIFVTVGDLAAPGELADALTTTAEDEAFRELAFAVEKTDDGAFDLFLALLPMACRTRAEAESVVEWASNYTPNSQWQVLTLQSPAKGALS